MVTLSRRQLLQGTGLTVAAAAMASLSQSPALAAGAAQGLTAYGASVCLGLGLGKHPPRDSTWFDQTRIALGVPRRVGINGAYPGTTLFDSIERQAARPERATWGHLFWGGHSDVTKGAARYVVPNLQTMADMYPDAPHLILGLTNGTEGGIGSDYYNLALAPTPGSINTKLAQAHGENFFDVQRWLVVDGLDAAGITPTAEDRLCISEDRVPFSLRHFGSKVHLNLIGQTEVAKQVTQRVSKWFV